MSDEAPVPDDHASGEADVKALLAEYEAWAIGYLSEISDEAMAVGVAHIPFQTPITKASH